MVARELRSSKAFITFVVCIAMLTDMFLANLILPVLPYALSERVGLAQEDVQRWNSILLASFGGAQMLGSLFFGWIGDENPSRQTPFVLGLVTLGTSTLCFALGTTIPVLILARLLQGLSSAVVFTIGSALLVDIVGNDEMGKASGYTSMSITIGILLGPVAGGFIYNHEGYFAVFLPAFAFIGLDISLRFIAVVEKRIPFESHPVESPNLTSPSVDVTGNTYGTDGRGLVPAGQDTSKSDRFPNADLHGSQRNTETESLLPKAQPRSGGSSNLILLSSPRFLVAIVCLFTVNSFTTGFNGVLPVYVHDIFGFNATKSACLFLILALPALLSPISGALTDRFGTKLPAAGGLLLLTPTLVLLRLIHPAVTSPFVKLGLMMSSIGISVTLLNPAFIKEISCAVQEIEQASPGIFGPYGANAQAYGLLSCAFAGGSMVGPLYAGFIRARFGWPEDMDFAGIISFFLH
ncbi:MAG: hypothetical protein FRX48_09606 [Lasallia pustulata]|uniref:Major facilitator superfamily (MFS) profile domain-containing protein n=1 Tax=Lasallia pustulata TaxID=136370 RepID=A0A5M8PCL3_9LECA|nr:MAG: hypothetical protein FRX48_09606 [Lasallia pustulata]